MVSSQISLLLGTIVTVLEDVLGSQMKTLGLAPPTVLEVQVPVSLMVITADRIRVGSFTTTTTTTTLEIQNETKFKTQGVVTLQ